MKARRSPSSTLTAYLFLTPALLGLFFLTIFPMIGVVIISLTNWSGLETPRFIGLDNFKEIFTTDVYFLRSVIATLYFALGAVISGIIYSFTVALMLNRRIFARGFWRSVYFIPYVVPSIGTAIVWSWLYESNFGVFNYILHLLGMNKVQWLQNGTTAVPSIIVMAVWGMGSMIVIFLAGLQNVPRAYLEAVEIDGGNTWHRFRHITIPMMTPIIFYNFLMSMISNLQIFAPAYALTRGEPSGKTLFMVYLMYREGFIYNNFGHAGALSLIFFVFIAALTVVIFGTSRRWMFYEGE
jgi:multiple sugar transport system permease protein